jgi:hypothetical protein
MTLDDEGSWSVIRQSLLNAGWTDDEIDEIPDESLEQVVAAINESLVRAHKKSAPAIVRAMRKSAAAEQAALLAIEKLGEAYDGEVPVFAAMQIMAGLRDANAEIEKSLKDELETLR